MQTVLYHIFLIAGFSLAFLLIVKLLREHRPPGNTLAWLLTILFIPYIGVPLYLLFGGRKVRRLSQEKREVLEPFSAVDSPDVHSEIEKLLHRNGAAPVRIHNDLTLVKNANEAYFRLVEHIRSAKKNINIMVFIFGNDAVGKAIVDELCLKAKEGVMVRLLVDGLGSFWSTGVFLDPLRKAGGHVSVFLPVLPLRRKWSANLRNHRKIWLFDDEVAIIGGRNIKEPYMSPDSSSNSWADFNIEIRGEAVPDFHQIFVNDWFYTTNEKLPAISPVEVSEKMPIQVMSAGPDSSVDALAQGVIASILHAKKKIFIVTPYFIPDELLVQSLILAVKLGREVKIIVPRRSNHLIADFARGSFLRQLIQEGVECFLFTPSMLHEKLIVIDDEFSIVGSANLDMRSLYLNFEVAAFIYSRKTTRELAFHVQDLLSKSIPLHNSHRLWREKLKLWGEDIARLFAPIL